MATGRLRLLQNVLSPLAFGVNIGAEAGFHPPAGLRDIWPLGCWKSKCRLWKLELRSAAGAGGGKGKMVSSGPCALIYSKNSGHTWQHILDPLQKLRKRA